MILDIDTKRQITRPAHLDTWRLIEKRLSKSEIDGIIDAIHAKIGEDVEIKVAGFIPGSDWTDTPFQIIYEKAALPRRRVKAGRTIRAQQPPQEFHPCYMCLPTVRP